MVVNKTGIKANSSIGLCEVFHEPIRTTPRKLKLETTKIGNRLELAFSVKAINDISGPEGFVASALIFGYFPPAFMKSEMSTSRSTNYQRAHLMNMARQEKGNIMA